jgi:Rrf2 family nitric oxide-sensitive transcriptional repressor
MRLTLHTDYAVRVLLYLGERRDRLCSVAEISQAHGISYNCLIKVAHDLGKKGFISGVRGRSGGIKLARPAYQINLGDMIRKMEGDMRKEMELAGCINCTIGDQCEFHDILGEGFAAFLSVLDNYTLCDLLQQSQKRMERLARIVGDAR